MHRRPRPSSPAPRAPAAAWIFSWILGCLLVVPPPVLAQGGTTGTAPAEPRASGGIEGRVRDAEGVPLRVVSVVVLSTDGERVLRTVTTDATGYFRAQPVGEPEAVIRFLRIGFEPVELRVRIPPEGRVQVDVTLREVAVELRGVAVEGDRSRARSRFEVETGITVRELAGADIRSLPGLAEADPIRALEVLPGVLAPTDFSAAFHVRGGSSDQNLILLDGFPIFNPFHLGGIFSVFNADMVDRVELASGGFPARYGGRVSSVLSVESDPGRGETALDAGVSLLAARATLSGGMGERLRDGMGLQSVRWRLSARRSYVDQLLRPVTEIPYHITDLQGILETWTPGGSRWTLTAYSGADVLDLGRLRLEDFPLRVDWRWGNQVVGSRWLRGFDGGGKLEGRAGFTRFDTELRFDDFDDSFFSSRVDQVTLALEGTVPVGGGWELGAGVAADRYDWANFAESGGTVFGDSGARGWNTATWLQGTWRSPGSWSVDGGLRIEGWEGGGVSILEPAPRLAVRRFLGDGDLALKASVGRYTQFVHSLRDEELPLGIDFWVTSATAIPHVVSDQLQVGVELFAGEGWFLSADAYLRGFEGVLTQNPVNDPNDPTDIYLPGRGRAVGADAMLERRSGQVQGSLAVSLLRADRTFPDVLSGEDPRPEVTYPPLFDRRLDADLVLRFPLGRGWDGGLRWHVGTGLPFTRPVASYPQFGPRQTRGGRLRWSPDDEGDVVQEGAEGLTAILLGPRNGERYPVYHRLDVSARREFRPRWGRITPYLNILNVYNQPNVLFYFYDFSGIPATRSGLTMFPFLPTVGVEMAF